MAGAHYAAAHTDKVRSGTGGGRLKFMADQYARAEECVDAAIARVGKTIVLGLPLALGKANHLANAFYARAKTDPDLDLTIFTALTLERPAAPNALAARLLEPIAERLYQGYPDLDYARDRRAGTLPPNVTVKEFFLPPGGLLNNEYAQQNYVSANYTHAGRDILDSGLNVIAQMVAPAPDGGGYSLSCNPDLSLDLAKALRRQQAAGRKVAVFGEINADLPYLGNDAAVAEDWFDGLFDAGRYTLFPVPARQVGLSDHALGLHAATLIRDGGTLQIGIGALADAVSHAIGLRHTKNDAFRRAVARLQGAPEAECPAIGGLAPFETGLYACSEMVTDGLLRLLECGVLSRKVHDAPGDDGFFLHGAFYLGPARMYQRLRDLPETLRKRINMTAVTRVNDLLGSEALDRAQRVDARFFNTAMKINGRGAAISDTLEDGRVVSGVGGQYNFVAMAHALEDGRSVIMLRATRQSGGKTVPNIVWQAGEITVPRHLRDIVVTEYGVADLRGKTDREVAIALAGISDARFQKDFLDAAKAAGKVEKGFEPPAEWRRNTPETLENALKDAVSDGVLPPYPLGTDLSATEIALKDALQWLGARNESLRGRAGLFAGALLNGAIPDWSRPYLERMDLSEPAGFGDRVQARLIVYALEQTGVRYGPGE